MNGLMLSYYLYFIKQAMIRHEIPEALMNWMENMLAGRNHSVCHRERTIEGTPDRGC
jgi:hypothetical protein